MRRLALAALLCAGPAWAEPTLDNPEAFEHAYALSLYQFDACGDALAGRMFRQALAARFATCPFSASARTAYAQRTRAQAAYAREWREQTVERIGGLPLQLDGMSMTCRAQQATDAYRAFRARLEDYKAGRLDADALIPASCAAPDIMP